ncbi:hypothetical protein AKJ61_04595 [candidate division MSBL1 archaeon SCGC-AAA259B11]|uniref:Uncharacterized protein n=1 Tax=candidate division MSBL1 archaeon SCGC-AAA259B11 TaxID=1698260 RepID=A0A133U334_9EURY|nr:hypothetical protein AKJ61_04595 [candidate division MSBL1 archaeon SCGC-AAA259B11]
MALEDHLFPGEKVKENYKKFYVTNKRIVKHENGITGESCEGIAHPNIQSISYEKNVRKRLIGIGVFLTLLGLVVGITLIIGLILIALAFIFKSSEFKIQDDQGEEWGSFDGGSKEAENFAKFAGEQILDGEELAESVKERIMGEEDE